jgi:uncharacterized membrane protein YccC
LPAIGDEAQTATVMCGRGRRDVSRVDDLDADDADEAQAGRERAVMRHASRIGTIVLFCLAIWLLTGAGYFWPGWVLAFGVFRLGVHARQVYGHPLRAGADL